MVKELNFADEAVTSHEKGTAEQLSGCFFNISLKYYFALAKGKQM
jgi:hypothetical protein